MATVNQGYDPIYGDQSDPDNRNRKRDEAMLDAFTLGLADVRGQSAREAAANTMLGVRGPNFSTGQLVGPGYAGDFSAQSYALPEDAQATLAEESPEGRAAMLAALQQMGELQNQAIGSQSDLDRQRAMVDAGQFANAREGLIRQDAMRRGQIGGAADMIMRAQAAQMGANRNQDAGLQSAQQAALQRLAGNQAQGALAGDIRRGDQAMGFANADIINRFNMANTAARNATRAQNTDAANKYGLRNLDARQQYLNAMADTSNANLQRGDTQAMQKANFDLQKAGGVASQMSGIAAGAGAQGDDRRGAAKDLAQMFMKFYGGGSGGGS